MSVTLKDLAQEVGLSTSSVSRILTGKGGKFSQDTVDRVLNAARRMNYSPNIYAKYLREQQYDVIGLMVPNVMNPYYGKILEEAERECEKAGYTLLVCVSKEKKDREKHYVDYFTRCRVKGVILASYDRKDVGEDLRRRGLRVVSLNEHIESDCINWVSVDNRKAMSDLTQYLINQGHKDIAYLHYQNAFKENGTPEFRIQGYCDCMESNGFGKESLKIEHVFHDTDDTEDSKIATRKLLCMDSIPTAIICHNNVFALGAYQAVTEAGFKVPEDISIACFDSMVDGAFDGIQFTCIQQQIRDLCHEAISLLDRDDCDDTAQDSCHVHVQHVLKVGETTAIKK